MRWQRVASLGFIMLLLLVQGVRIAQVSGAPLSDEQRRVLTSGFPYFNTEAQNLDCGKGAAGGGGKNPGGTLSTNVPDPWRKLIMDTAPTYPEVDPRTVAAELWIEHRGWPTFSKEGWAESGAYAKGPWQFIPSSWASMGTDGNGDGVADPNDPYDAVHAAFKHNIGSAGNPIAFVGYTDGKTPEENFQTVVYSYLSGDLLSHIGKYNGSGAPDGVRLADFGRGENSDYVIMGYWLLATDFAKGWNDGSFVDATKSGSLFDDPSAATAGTGAPAASGGCTKGSGTINTDGYVFPVAPQQKGQNGGVAGMSALPCTDLNCHHDNTVAFDISRQPGGDSAIGTPVYAFRNGTIEMINDAYKDEDGVPMPGCYTFQLHADDTYYYWYGHIQGVTVSDGQTVTAGQQVAVIGERRCTGNTSSPHLHIDRGCVIDGVPQTGGRPACRDPALKDVMNKVFEALPQ